MPGSSRRTGRSLTLRLESRRIAEHARSFAIQRAVRFLEEPAATTDERCRREAFLFEMEFLRYIRSEYYVDDLDLAFHGACLSIAPSPFLYDAAAQALPSTGKSERMAITLTTKFAWTQILTRKAEGAPMADAEIQRLYQLCGAFCVLACLEDEADGRFNRTTRYFAHYFPRAQEAADAFYSAAGIAALFETMRAPTDSPKGDLDLGLKREIRRLSHADEREKNARQSLNIAVAEHDAQPAHPTELGDDLLREALAIASEPWERDLLLEIAINGDNWSEASRAVGRTPDRTRGFKNRLLRNLRRNP